MKRLLPLFTVLLLISCSSNQPPKLGVINWQSVGLTEALSQAQANNKLLLVYFFSNW